MDVSREPENGNEPLADQICNLMEVIDYSSASYRTSQIDLVDAKQIEALPNIPKDCVRWMNIDGVCSEATLAALGKAFSIHPLVIENILNMNQRARVEEYPGLLHIVAKMLYLCEDELVLEQVNFILGPNYVMTFGERVGDVFGEIRSHLSIDGTQVRNAGADYLLFRMLDALVEGYFVVLEVYEDQIDDLEDSMMAQTTQEHLQEIRLLKREIIKVSRCAWPLKDVASLLARETISLIQPETEPYIRDVNNYIAQIIDMTEFYRELLSGLAELQLSNTSNKLNGIMKVLTIISTIFIPLTFIAGVYGMNFRYMPELYYRWGYAIVWGVMIVIAGGMIYYFKKQKWF